MRTRLLLLVCAGVLVCSEARAEGYYGPDPDNAPSVFTYGSRGLGLGVIDGLAVGYFVARSGGFHSRDWKPVLISTGVGAVSGVALGLSLGLYDVLDDNPGVGSITLRDMFYGAGLGALTGTIVGCLVGITEDDTAPVPYGAALGALIGTGVGLAFGIVEGQRILESPRHRRQAALEPTFAFAPGAHGRVDLSFGVRSQF